MRPHEATATIQSDGRATLHSFVARRFTEGTLRVYNVMVVQFDMEVVSLSEFVGIGNRPAVYETAGRHQEGAQKQLVSVRDIKIAGRYTIVQGARAYPDEPAFGWPLTGFIPLDTKIDDLLNSGHARELSANEVTHRESFDGSVSAGCADECST